MQVVLWESFRAVFYTPFYVAMARDAFAGEALTVEFGTAPPGANVADALRAGQVDVAWGGPMRLMQDFDKRDPQRDIADNIVGFCEVVARDPFFLVGRGERDFSLSDLSSMSLAAVSEVPTPWMCLQEDMRRAGLDPDTVNRVPGLTMPDAVEALKAGKVDVIQIFEPMVQQLVASGQGAVWYSAADRGLTSYTTLYSTRRWYQANPDIATALVRALYRTQQWISSSSAGEIAETVAPYFSDIDRSTLVAAIARYIDAGIWGATPILDAGGFDRQAAGLASGGFIARKPDYADCVDMTIAEAVVASKG